MTNKQTKLQISGYLSNILRGNLIITPYECSSDKILLSIEAFGLGNYTPYLSTPYMITTKVTNFFRNIEEYLDYLWRNNIIMSYKAFPGRIDIEWFNPITIAVKDYYLLYDDADKFFGLRCSNGMTNNTIYRSETNNEYGTVSLISNNTNNVLCHLVTNSFGYSQTNMQSTSVESFKGCDGKYLSFKLLDNRFGTNYIYNTSVSPSTQINLSLIIKNI